MRDVIEPIARQSYQAASSFFNAAGTGLISSEVERAVRDCPNDWHTLVGNVREQVGQLFGKTKEHVSLFHNTTSGIQRVFQRVRQIIGPRSSLLLTTDAEYPGTIAAVDESWQGPVAMVEISNLVVSCRHEEVLATLQQAFLMTRPQVIYISQVTRALGFPIDTEFFRFAKTIDPQVVIIVDAAQAIGNVACPADLFDYVDFYVCSGHKWIGGKPTLGLVCSHTGWKIADPAQAYSSSSGSGGTGSIEILRALSESLKEFVGGGVDGAARRLRDVERHNSSLAARFCERIRDAALPVRVVPGVERWPASGIVALTGDWTALGGVVDVSGDSTRVGRVAEAGRVMAAIILPEQWVTSAAARSAGPRILIRPTANGVRMVAADLKSLVVPVATAGAGVLRFCFHHFHSSRDVDALVDKLCVAAH